VINYWGLKLGKTMTQSYRFFAALILNEIMRCDESASPTLSGGTIGSSDSLEGSADAQDEESIDMTVTEDVVA